LERYVDWRLLFLTAFGAALLWARWSYSPTGTIQIKAMGLEALVRYLPFSRGWRTLIGFLVFIAIGAIVGMVMVAPVNARQALAAGFGWTALLGHPTESKPKDKGKGKGSLKGKGAKS